MSEDEIKKIEQRGYSRGYQAGKKAATNQRKTARHFLHEYQQKQAFLDRAFLAALPACIQVAGWKTGDKPITNHIQRTKLAWDFAEEALKQRRHP